MSFDEITHRFLVGLSRDYVARLIAGRDGCNLDNWQLRRRFGLGRRGLAKCKRALIDAGYVEWVRRPRPEDWHRGKTEFTIVVKRIAPQDGRGSI